MTSNAADLFIKVSLKDFLFSKPEKRKKISFKDVYQRDIYIFSCSLVSSSNFSFHSSELSEAEAASAWPLTISDPSAAGLSRALAT